MVYVKVSSGNWHLWSVGSVVKGTICMRYRVSVPDPVLPEMTEQVTKRHEIIKHLKQRYVPFGSGD